MRILLTNDDGILAPGLAAMQRALGRLGEVTVVAPDSVQSASAHAITVQQAIPAQRIHVNHEFFGWSIGGRPADCVKLAIYELVEDKPDLVVSGINDGANVATNVLYSGTVAAAAEGALLGYPAVAVSLERGEEMDFDGAADIAMAIIERLLADGLEGGQLMNVNIPSLQPGRPRGVRAACQATQGMNDHYHRRDLDDGVRTYLLDGAFSDPEGTDETDLHAISQGYVSITPLQFDLTDRVRLERMAAIEWGELVLPPR